MQDFLVQHNNMLGEKAAAALQKNHFTAAYYPDRAAAVEAILAAIPPGATIGVGGSITTSQLGLLDLLAQRGHTIYNHNKPGLTAEEAMELRRKEIVSDVFLTSTNALTLDGKLVNVDGSGNRVAAMIFGPRKVMVIAGINKIVKDVDAAMERIKLFAAPTNNMRLNRPNPCVKAGECMDCQLPTRICNVYSIMAKRPSGTDIAVYIIGENLGY